MTVKELIAILDTFPLSAKVYRQDGDDYVDPAPFFEPVEGEVIL